MDVPSDSQQTDTRHLLVKELMDLRRKGQQRGDAETFPLVARNLSACGFFVEGVSFQESFNAFLRALGRSKHESAHTRTLLELFRVHDTTKSLSPSAALAVPAGRFHGTPVTTSEREAFYKNEMAKALDFSASVLLDREVEADGVLPASLDSLAMEFRSDQPAQWHIRYHPQTYRGPVWITLLPAPVNRNQDHDVTVIWGEYLFLRTFSMRGGTFSLVHQKTVLDQLPLYVGTKPDATIMIGQGSPRDGELVDINEGWVRMNGAPVRR
jgi:hypothetical protein